ncbi:MAG: class I SAM-dependent methyltransferase, partial [Gemmatimonadota bacterium]
YRVGLMGSSDFHAPRPGRSYIHLPPHLPSLGALVEAMSEGTPFQVREVRSLAPDYAETLRRWRDRFELAPGEAGASAAGPGPSGDGAVHPRLRRLWRFYLAYCEGGFRAGEIDDLQIALRRPARAGGRVSDVRGEPAGTPFGGREEVA